MPWLTDESCPRCQNKLFRLVTNESIEDSCYVCGYFLETMSRGYVVVEKQELEELMSAE